MAIHLRGGAPAEIVECYKGHDNGGGFYLVKIRRTGVYFDGSGKDRIGEIVHASDRIAKGWTTTLDLTAEDGLREIHQACDAAPEGTPDNPGQIMNYYWPNVFDKKGNRKKAA